MTACTHPTTTRVVDRLGVMTDQGAHVVADHDECVACGATTGTHTYADPNESTSPYSTTWGWQR